MALSNLSKDIFLGESAATSHMTSNKMGVLQFNSHKWVCIGWKWIEHQLHPQRKTGCDLQTQGWIHGKRNLGCENHSTTNHDLFSFAISMKEGWQMNRRWKERGLIIELFKTTRASMRFDRMIPSGSSWLMGVKVQRVMDHAHSAIEPGKESPCQNSTRSLDTQVNTY